MKHSTLIVIGCSLGGFKALRTIFSELAADFSLPIALVQHVGEDSSGLAAILAKEARIPVKEAEDKEPIQDGTIYLAPAGYHLLVERGATFSLSVDEKENYSRPSIDTLFESAAEACGSGLVGVILTGANSDGAKGLAKIHGLGGRTVVQNPASAEASEMPQAALHLITSHRILSLHEIGRFLNSLSANGEATEKT